MIVENKTNWSVYIIICKDGSLYTGISTDIERRFEQHKNKKGAKYFYSHYPDKIVFIENNHTRRSASQREFAIKSLTKSAKEKLINENK